MVGHQSFGIQTAQDFVDNLVRPDLDAFRKQSLDSRAAIRVALSFTHLVEWVFEDRGSLDLSKIGVATAASVQDLRSQIERIHSELRWLRDVSNGSKHCAITKYTPEVTGSGVAEWGQLNWGEFPADRPVFAITLNGDRKNYENVVETATRFLAATFLWPLRRAHECSVQAHRLHR